MLLAACSCQQAATMSAYKFTPHAVGSPDAPQKPLVRKRARSGGAAWVRVSRERSPSKAKRPQTAGSQEPACTHQEHQILTTAEAASFASQFWDRKVHPTKASQQEFLATCIDVDLEKNVKCFGALIPHQKPPKYLLKCAFFYIPRPEDRVGCRICLPNLTQ